MGGNTPESHASGREILDGERNRTAPDYGSAQGVKGGMSMWHPIETAPKDGYPIVVRGFIHKIANGVVNTEYFEVAYWRKDWGRFIHHATKDREIGSGYLTHWMPLPSPPEE